MVPLYLKYIPLDIYGAWLAVTNVIAWLSVIDPGLSNVLLQKVGTAYGKNDQNALNGLITNGIVVNLFVSLLVFTGGLLVEPFVFEILNLPMDGNYKSLGPAFMMAVFGSAMMTISYGFMAINQGLLSSLGNGLIFVIINLSSLAFAAWLLFEGYGLLALPLALVFRGVGLSFCNVCYLVWRVKAERMTFQLSFAGFRGLVSLMSYTFLGRAAGGIAGNLDAFIVTRFLGPEAAPVLLLTRKAPDLSRTFLERPSSAFMPAVANLYGTGDIVRAREVLLRLIRIIIWIMGLAVTGFLLLNHAFVQLWVGEELFAGPAVNLTLVLGLLLAVFTVSLSNMCYALGNIKGNSLALLVQSLFSIPLMYFGGKYFGMFGVALAPVLSMLSVSIWYFPQIFRKLLKISEEEVKGLFREFVYVTLVGTIISFCFVFLDPMTWTEFIFTGTMIFFVYTGGLCLVSKALRSEMIAIIMSTK
jgi:O-antigen/teichoic acid export membrane protein